MLLEQISAVYLDPFAPTGGTPGKRHRMREAGVWLGDRTSYFDDGGHGFVSYEPRIPSDVDLEQFRELGWPSPDGHHPVLETRSPVLQAHTRMVNFQLQQVCPYDVPSPSEQS